MTLSKATEGYKGTKDKEKNKAQQYKQQSQGPLMSIIQTEGISTDFNWHFLTIMRYSLPQISLIKLPDTVQFNH